VEAFEQFVRYANQRGRPEGRPYFTTDGKRPLTGAQWGALRAKFSCDSGITNVWHEPRGTGG
jgi:site-specific DNA-methyltransferase (adenine-specific)